MTQRVIGISADSLGPAYMTQGVGLYPCDMLALAHFKSQAYMTCLISLRQGHAGLTWSDSWRGRAVRSLSPQSCKSHKQT